jgi:hypothetical protein
VLAPVAAGGAPDAAGRRREMTIVWWIVGIVVTVVAVTFFIGLLLTVLFITGGPSTDLVCTDSVSGVERAVQSTAPLSDALQARLDALDDQLDAGSAGQVNFNESDATSRSLQFALEHDIPVTELVVCFLDGGIIEGRAELDLGELVGALGLLGGSVKAEARGTVDLSGASIRVDLTDFSVGNVPGFATNLAEGPLEDLINNALADDAQLDHSYALAVEEINAVLSGTP